ncbi:MAG: DUF4166 domain-containing protein [Proteobacteria bacterium]|nr:DUF4166 domain-containing protein [Pseudomonadota bacterium]
MAGARVAGRYRVLVLGGTGVFGSRLASLLQDDPQIAVTIAARDPIKVAAVAAEYGIAGRALKWERDLDSTLATGAFDALVHVAGPFQGQDYTVAETCIRHRVHYLDLSDDRAFVCGIDRLNGAAKDSDVVVCSGASTAPALTAAVVEEAIGQGAVIESVTFAIVPGNDAPRGLALVKAILSTAGKPIAAQPGRTVWGDLSRIKVPGLGRRWVAACDLPEPVLFDRRFAIGNTQAGAGLELSVLHVGLWLLTLLVRARLVRSLAPLASMLAAIADKLRRFGTDRGGLRIDLHGASERRSWCLVAEGGDGPFVPATPAAALIRKLMRGEVTMRGAMPCVGLLTLADIEEEWRRAGLRICAGWGEGGASLQPSLYRRVLGKCYDELPEACRTLHDSGESVWEGRCTVDGARTPVGRVLSWLFQMPPAIADASIVVEFEVRNGRETWTRRVGGRTMRSRQYIGVRRAAGSIVESFGPFDFDLRVTVEDQRLALTMTGMRLMGVSLPRFAWPIITAFEAGADGRFNFDVNIELPGIGRLVHYRGWLKGR